MDKIKAVFFDRDNTLTYKNQYVLNKYYRLVESVSGKSFCDDKQKMFKTFNQIKKLGFNTNSYDNEVLFYKQYYKQVLINECGFCDDKIEKLARQIFDIMWLKDKVLFDDVIPTFEKIKSKGLKIGIISDTTLSLQKSLETLNLGKFIDCYTSSKEVGVMKPNPEIYLTALKKLDVLPSECLYIDDFEEEVIGAQNLGIKAFRINRNKTEYVFQNELTSLNEVLKYI